MEFLFVIWKNLSTFACIIQNFYSWKIVECLFRNNLFMEVYSQRNQIQMYVENTAKSSMSSTVVLEAIFLWAP